MTPAKTRNYDDEIEDIDPASEYEKGVDQDDNYDNST